MAVDSLTDAQRAILDLEGQRFDTVGGKETAICAMGLTPTRYYQLLNQVLARPAALAYDPITVNRLSRIINKGSR